jgi:HEAT repeat protein
MKQAVLQWAERKADIWVNIADAQNVEAARGFEALGASAKDAVPALVEIYGRRISLGSQCATAYALGCIGPAARRAIPPLLGGVTNANVELRRVTVESLGRIHSEPELAVPALIRALDDADQQVRYEAANALSAFGTNAMAAVPALIEAFKNQDKRINKTAAIALKAIDAEAATKAGVK